VAKFLVKPSYSMDGTKGVQSAGGTSRREAVANLAESAAAASIAVNASGAATSEVIVLLTPEEIDEAAKISVDYRPPGS
jgi:hypothetical protein